MRKIPKRRGKRVFLLSFLDPGSPRLASGLPGTSKDSRVSLRSPVQAALVPNALFSINRCRNLPSAGGRRGAHGCVFHGRKMRGVATNVYSRKTLEKTGKVWSTNFKCERFESCFYARGRY